MRHPVYSVRYAVVLINSLALTITLYSSVIKAPAYNDTKYPLYDVINEFSCNYKITCLLCHLRI
jgi:hypothetical protein